MGRMKNLLLDDDSFRESDGRTLQDFARLLKGEVVDGRYILCASPGFPEDNRSCKVRINLELEELVWVYYCIGNVWKTKAAIERSLGLQRTESRLDKFRRFERAQAIWNETVQAQGTLVERYLRGRGIKLPVSDSIRFHPQLYYPGGGTWPGMVTFVTGPNGGMQAIHRTYLNLNGSGKAPVEEPKLTLGGTSGGYARLSLPAPKMVIGEGIETTLSAMQLTGLPGWAGLNANGLKTIPFPKEVRSVVIAIDLDKDGIGERAGREAARRLVFEGRSVSVARPNTGKDFNDVLRAVDHE